MLLARTIINKVDPDKTIIRLMFHAHELIGSINNFYIYIYDLSIPPSNQIQLTSFLKNAELGLRFNAKTIPLESLNHNWWKYIFRFEKLQYLKLDCKPGMIESMISFLAASKLRTALWRITLTINTNDFDFPSIQGIFLKVPKLFDAIGSVEIVDIYLLGTDGADLILDKMCFNDGAEYEFFDIK